MPAIKCNKDLFNGGKCFTKGKLYETKKQLVTEASLIDAMAINDLGEKHIIGMWWRNFKIVR